MRGNICAADSGEGLGGDMGNENHTGIQQATCPEEVLRMIAWYYDEALGEDERVRIEAHAAECAACRGELEWMSENDRDNAADDATALEIPSADAVYERIRDKIATHPGQARPAVRSQPTTRSSETDWRRLALAASAVLALLGAFAGGRIFPGNEAASLEPVYETASAPAPVVVSTGPSLDVIFQSDATAERINGALRGIGGTIAEGPTRLGVYRVQLQPGADAIAAARMLRADGEGVASLAEVAGA